MTPRVLNRSHARSRLPFFFDELVFEDGLFEASLNAEASFQQYRTADQVSTQDRQRARVIPEPGTGFRLDVRIEPEAGGPAISLPPASGRFIGYYAAEWMTGVTDAFDELDLNWVSKVVMAEQDLADSGLAPVVSELADELARSAAERYREPMIGGFATGAIARDLVVAQTLDAMLHVTSLFEPVLTGEGSAIPIRTESVGAAALGIVVPDVASLRWEAIVEFREHPACQEARARLREIEQRALQEDPVDAADFQRRLGIEVTNDLFAVIDDLAGSLELDLARHAAGFVLSMVPLASEIAAVGETAVAARQRRRSWRAALMKLREPRGA